jgi:pantetheine-phosphate adenylyltransferase
MSKGRAIYPGSFDPVTHGHLDIIQRASQLFESVIVAVAYNEAKSPLFTADERVTMIRESVGGVPGVTVRKFDGLLVDLAKEEDSFIILRGLRVISDFEFEFQMALMNKRLEPRIETVFLTPKEDSTFISSRIVKEVARLGGDIRPFVTPSVAKCLGEKYKGS